MKKVSFILAALATIAVAAPTVASAQSFGFSVGPDRDYYYGDGGPRAGFGALDHGRESEGDRQTRDGFSGQVIA